MDNFWDCIIVGGGAQSNLPAHGIGGLLGHDGRKPAELYETGRRELAEYPSVEVRIGEVAAGERSALLRGWSDDIVVLTDGPDALEDDDRDRLARKGVLVGTTPPQRSTLAHQLGAECADPTPVAQDPVAVDGFYRTTAPGVFAAGDLSVQMPQVAEAIASGSHAAAAVVQSLMADEYGLAVPEGRSRVNA